MLNLTELREGKTFVPHLIQGDTISEKELA